MAVCKSCIPTAVNTCNVCQVPYWKDQCSSSRFAFTVTTVADKFGVKYFSSAL